MGDAEKPPKRHRVHSGLTGTRLDRAAVALEVWPAPLAPGEAPRASHRLVLTSVEWVDLIAGVIVGELDVTATDLNALRSDVARMHERWRASVEQRAHAQADDDSTGSEP